MKKTLLLTAVALMGAGAAQAAQEQVFNGFALSSVSPDGRYMTSEVWGTMMIRDNETGQTWDYEGGDMFDYSTGHGNCWSENGIMVGSTIYDGDAAYWYNGEWHNIESAQAYEGMAFTNAISSDGKYIVGDVNNINNTLGSDGTMMIPILWADMDGDMVYETETLLPWPEKDLMNCNPQYVNALAVSADGDVIIGQVRDCRGYYVYPIMWTKNSEEEWEYSYPGIELFNPNHCEIPVAPVEPAYVDIFSYMTEEEKAAYDEAVAECYETGDWSNFPDARDYLSPEALEEYDAAYEEYNQLINIYNEEFSNYIDLYNEIVNASVCSVFNSCSVSPNGKFMCMAAELPKESFWDPSVNYSVSYNLENGTTKRLPTTNSVACTQIFDDGTMLGCTLPSWVMTEPTQSYIYLPGTEDFILLVDYFRNSNPGVAEWMEENMIHDIVSYDEDYNEVLLEDVLATGTPYGNSDLSMIGCSVMSMWEDDFEYNSFLFSDLNTCVGVSALKDSNMQIKSVGRGKIALSGAIESVEIYSMAGACVYSVKNPVEVIETGLASGVYVVKATDINGQSSTMKVVF